MPTRFAAFSTAFVLLLAAPAAAQDRALSAGDFEGAPQWLGEAYEARGFEPVWSKNGRPNAAFERLVEVLREAEAKGLDPEAYAVRAVERLRRESAAVREQGASRVFSAYALDLLEGRTPQKIDYEQGFEPYRNRRRGQILEDAFSLEDPMDYLDRASPDNMLVERLLEALEIYRGYAARGGWEKVASSGDVLIDEGDEHPLVPAIADRLAAEGFLRRATDEPLYDARLAEAIGAFQKSRSMVEDSIVGPDTITALNETPEVLIEKLLVNIERARWLPGEFGDRAAFVNSAGYSLILFENGRKIGEMDVIVGEEETQTPIFADTMETVVVNPYWNVPMSILIEEIAPQQIEDRDYIHENAYEVVVDGEVRPPSSVDWEAAAAGQPSFRVRQKPGGQNALGRIKFLFPNEYAVYLHDTPARSLFSQDVRTFSHGCIRIEDPLRFGAWILDRSERELTRLIESGERQEISSPAVPVYITYFTAWAEPGEPVTFSRDIYDRDAAVLRKLMGS